MNNKVKFIPGKTLTPGQECGGYKSGTSHSFCSFKIEKVEPDGVHVLMWGKTPTILPLDAYYEVPLTEKEFTEKYFIEAKAVYEACQNKVFSEYAGYHEMWNTWIDYNPYEMAANLIENEMELLGYFELDSPKISWFGDMYTIGLVVRQDDETFWCHANKEYLDEMLELYKGDFVK